MLMVDFASRNDICTVPTCQQAQSITRVLSLQGFHDEAPVMPQRDLQMVQAHLKLSQLQADAVDGAS